MPWLIGIGIVALFNFWFFGGSKPKPPAVVFIGPGGSGKTTLATFFATGEYPTQTSTSTFTWKEIIESEAGIFVQVIDTRGSRPGFASDAHDEWKEISKEIGESDRIIYVVSAADLFDGLRNANVVQDAIWVRKNLKKNQVMQVVTHLDSTPLRESEGFAQLCKAIGDPIWSGNLLDRESATALCHLIGNSLKSEK